MKLTIHKPIRKTKSSYSDYFVWWPLVVSYDNRLVIYWLTNLIRRPIEKGENTQELIDDWKKVVPMFVRNGYIYRERFWQENL